MLSIFFLDFLWLCYLNTFLYELVGNWLYFILITWSNYICYLSMHDFRTIWFLISFHCLSNLMLTAFLKDLISYIRFVLGGCVRMSGTRLALFVMRWLILLCINFVFLGLYWFSISLQVSSSHAYFASLDNFHIFLWIS